MNENEKKLIELLQEKNPQTATELACQLNVSNRTVYRWAEKLAEKGIKITSTKGRFGGIFLEQDVHNMSDLETTPCHTKNDNMTKSLKNNVKLDSWIEISFTQQEKIDKLAIKFDICKKAVLEKNVLSFSYTLPEGKTLNCTTEPVRLYLYDNQWHILAWIRKVDKFKLFKLSYMSDLELLSEKFSRDADFIIQEVLN